MLIETHAHLDYPDFANDLDDVIRRATEAGVTRIITIGTSIESSRRAVELAEKYPSVYAAIGIHPTNAEQAGEDVITPLRELAKSPRVVAIGETGLDYHHLQVSKQRNRKMCKYSARYKAEPKNNSKPALKMAPTNRNRPIFLLINSIWRPSSGST